MKKIAASFLYLRHSNYIEVYLVITAVCIIALENQHNMLALIPLAIVASIACVVLTLDYLYKHNAIMDYLCIVTAGFIVGYRPDLLVVFVMASVASIRIFKHPNKIYVQCILLFITSFLLGLGTNLFVQINNKISIDIIHQTVVLFVFYVVFALECINQSNQIKKLSKEVSISKIRFKTMVRIINGLSRFLPNQIRQPIIQEKATASLFNKRAKMTLLFSDIIGFTDLSDNISADALTEILNVYMYHMTLVAERHGAVLDKFIGDGMMCFFGAENKGGIQDNAIACVAMALDMRREMNDLRRLWRDQGYDLHIRIGINTGYCHVGNFGSDNRMSYTAIGKEVNLASRLEGVADTDEIIISQSTFEYVSYQYTCEMVGDVKLKGFEDAVRCYRVLDKSTSELKRSQWVDHALPGFNLHLNFKDIKIYDYRQIRNQLEKAIDRVDEIEKSKKNDMTKR